MDLPGPLVIVNRFLSGYCSKTFVKKSVRVVKDYADTV